LRKKRVGSGKLEVGSSSPVDFRSPGEFGAWKWEGEDF